MLKKCAHAQQQDAERKTRNAVQPLRRGGMRLVAAVRRRSGCGYGAGRQEKAARQHQRPAQTEKKKGQEDAVLPCGV